MEMGLDDPALEDYLDTRSPEDFRKFKGFGASYVDYVRLIRGEPVADEVRSLLDPDVDTLDIAPPYVRQGPEFYTLESGKVDCRVTMTLSPSQAKWLSGLITRLPDMYPDDHIRQDVGYIVGNALMSTIKLDGERHGGGTMSREKLEEMKGRASKSKPTKIIT